MENFNILLLNGDGIGPDVMAEAEKIIAWLNANTDITLTTEHGLLGGDAYDKTGSPYPPETQKQAHKADAVLLAAIGGPKWKDVPFAKRPEQGLLDIRSDLDLFANLRPAQVFPGLEEASSLKNELIKGLDILIVRELMGGIYFGTPRGIETLPDGQKRGYNTTSYSTTEVARITDVAFKAARLRNNKVCSVDKANVLESSVVWREAISQKAAADFPDIHLEHQYVDNAAMQLTMHPQQFDVIVAPNLAGDVLSDIAAAITGSIGLLPSASVGVGGKGLYEPVHGSAPDIAGQGIANPLAMILSLAMLLETTCQRPDLAALLKGAVAATIKQGARTADMARGNEKTLSTTQMGKALMTQLNQLQELS